MKPQHSLKKKKKASGGTFPHVINANAVHEAHGVSICKLACAICIARSTEKRKKKKKRKPHVAQLLETFEQIFQVSNTHNSAIMTSAHSEDDAWFNH